MAKTEDVFAFLDSLLGRQADLDYPAAANGVQVQGPGEVKSLVSAVDASERILGRAARRGADLVLVHHGLFWDPERRVTGRRYRKLKLLLGHQMALYSSHLPLDAHPEVGNAASLLRELGAEPEAPFGSWKGVHLGWTASVDMPMTRLAGRLESAVGGPVQTLEGGPEEVRRLAVVTGAGASFLQEAADEGVDLLITGEAPHHAAMDARELGVTLLLAGHYRTETFGVRAVGELLRERFGLDHHFEDDPSGL
jgi:dinuclear metal center YbgI/SA1388 family protein